MTLTTPELEAVLGDVVARQPSVGLAVGIVRDGGLAAFRGHGLADIPSGQRITEDTCFRVASITKTFTAIAVMQLCERGLVDLDRPANEHLRSFTLAPTRAGWPPATVRHLLTHTAGLAEVAHLSGLLTPDFGESVPAGEPIPSLASFYGATLPTYAEPGTRFVYNNHGPATLGQIVEDVTGLPLHEYVRDHIFEPLGMTDSTLVRPPQDSARLATGYEIGSRGVRRIEERDMVTTGAASAYSTPRDMARYAAALTAGGASPHSRILQTPTLEQMLAPQYRPDPRIPGMGLGFFRYRVAGHDAVGHQGTHPGFHSQITLVPDHGVAVIAFTNGAHHPDFWLPGAVARLLGRILPSDGDAPGPAPDHPEVWADLCGWYRLDARATDVRLRGMLGAGVEVLVRRGRLIARFLTPIPALAHGFDLEPDDANDPYAFRITPPDDAMDPIRLAFAQDPAGATDRLCLDVMPLVMRKQPDATNPRRWATGALGTLSAAALATAVSRR
jgi:CubicO group peptidase (beta-lactamase class C family)